MRQYKKRTLALILASAVTVVGAFGAENYKNSLMSLKFESGAGGVNVTLLTKLNYDKDVNIVRKDANTYVLMLPEVNSETNPSDYELGNGIQSVDVQTMPYTTSSTGYTKVTIKTQGNLALSAKTSVFLPAPAKKEEISPDDEQRRIEYERLKAEEEARAREAAERARQEQEQAMQEQQTKTDNTIHSRSGVSQTAPVDINQSVKQFQPSNVNTTSTPRQNNAISVDDLKSPKEANDNSKDLAYIIFGTIMSILLAAFFWFRAKGKMAEIIGEQTEYNLDDEPKKETKKKKPAINVAIKNLDKKYSKPVKMPVNKLSEPEEAQNEVSEPETEQEVHNVVDLDELLAKEQKNPEADSETAADSVTEEDTDDEENLALEEFLSSFSFDEENEEEQKEQDNEELYNQCINNENIEFTKTDVNNISSLMSSEISDETRKHAPEFLESSEKNKKPSARELVENFVTLFAVHQNITFTKEDVDALYKLISVELDNDFITDLRTNPERVKEMQEEIEKQKAKPHKSSELLTLNVKDMLPDLSKALKKQGHRQIEYEGKAETVYYSEGYEVSTLQLDETLPDLSVEINNKKAYQERPSDELQYADESYEVEKMSIGNELPNLKDALKHPEKYDKPQPKKVKVDEKALLNNISNITFKPFDDGTREFEVVNEIEDNTPSVDDMQEEFNQFGDGFEIMSEEEIMPAQENDNDDFASLYDNNYVDLDSQNDEVLEEIAEDTNTSVEDNNTLVQLTPRKKETSTDRKDSAAEELLQKIQKNEVKAQEAPKPVQVPDEHKSENIAQTASSNTPEFCILDGEKYSIISSTNFTDKMGCYLAKNSSGYIIIGFVGDKTFKIKQYEKLNIEKLQSRISEKLDDGTQRYIVRIGIHKFIMNVTSDDMQFVIDLC